MPSQACKCMHACKGKAVRGAEQQQRMKGLPLQAVQHARQCTCACPFRAAARCFRQAADLRLHNSQSDAAYPTTSGNCEARPQPTIISPWYIALHAGTEGGVVDPLRAQCKGGVVGSKVYVACLERFLVYRSTESAARRLCHLQLRFH